MERIIELVRIERKAYVRAGQCVVVTNRPSQIEQCSKRVEKDRFDHSSQTFHSEEIASKRPNQLRHATAGHALNSDSRAGGPSPKGFSSRNLNSPRPCPLG